MSEQRWDVEDRAGIDLTGVRRVAVRLVSGSVDVVGHAGDRARVEVDDVQGPAVKVRLSDDGTLTVSQGDIGWAGFLSWVARGLGKTSARVALSVPRGAALELGVVSAEATVAGVDAPTHVKAVSGDVTLEGCSRGLVAETVSGDIEASGLEGELRFHTVSGDLTVADGGAATVHSESVSGDVLLDLRAPVRVEVQTVSGDVTVRVPREAALHVDARSTSGRLTSALAGLTSTSAPADKRLSGSTGEHAAPFRARTVSGDVVLLAKDEPFAERS
ncbi:MAG: DUF4097 family beta strand repeat-containing protein [Motilibacteraceae bacterium]